MTTNTPRSAFTTDGLLTIILWWLQAERLYLLGCFRLHGFSAFALPTSECTQSPAAVLLPMDSRTFMACNPQRANDELLKH